MDEKGKIVKITFEYENAKESLCNDDAVEFLKMLNNMCCLLQIRGQNPFEEKEFDWQKEN